MDLAVNRVFCATLQLLNLSVDCAKRGVQTLKRLLVCNEKNLSYGFRFFMGDVISGIG